jgi:hypothetical protein
VGQKRERLSAFLFLAQGALLTTSDGDMGITIVQMFFSTQFTQETARVNLHLA